MWCDKLEQVEGSEILLGKHGVSSIAVQLDLVFSLRLLSDGLEPFEG